MLNTLKKKIGFFLFIQENLAYQKKSRKIKRLAENHPIINILYIYTELFLLQYKYIVSWFNQE
jgi:formate dehydrogenase maturation protein FdhE